MGEGEGGEREGETRDESPSGEADSKRRLPQAHHRTWISRLGISLNTFDPLFRSSSITSCSLLSPTLPPVPGCSDGSANGLVHVLCTTFAPNARVKGTLTLAARSRSAAQPPINLAVVPEFGQVTGGRDLVHLCCRACPRRVKTYNDRSRRKCTSCCMRVCSRSSRRICCVPRPALSNNLRAISQVMWLRHARSRYLEVPMSKPRLRDCPPVPCNLRNVWSKAL